MEAGTSAKPPDPGAVTEVGDYAVEARLGEGGFGTVYLGVHRLIGKRVAIKVLSPKYSADPHVLSRFISEARAVNQIRHRHIVDIFSFGELPDGRRYFVMEYLEGVTLESHLRKSGPLELALVLAILDPMARALDAAHQAGFAHRDLKPANIILTKGSEGEMFPKLLDFGIAKLLDDSLPRSHHTDSGVAVGTPDYMSPEQVEGSGVDHRTDMYSFGVICYRMLTGELPFKAASSVEMMIKHLRETPPSLREVAPRIPAHVDRLVLSLLEKDRTKRPDSLTGWIQRVRSAPAKSRNRTAIWVGLAIAGLAVAASYVLRHQSAPAPRPVIAPAPPPRVLPPPIAPPQVIAPPPPVEKKIKRKPPPTKRPPSEDGLPSWDAE